MVITSRLERLRGLCNCFINFTVKSEALMCISGSLITAHHFLIIIRCNAGQATEHTSHHIGPGEPTFCGKRFGWQFLLCNEQLCFGYAFTFQPLCRGKAAFLPEYPRKVSLAEANVLCHHGNRRHLFYFRNSPSLQILQSRAAIQRKPTAPHKMRLIYWPSKKHHQLIRDFCRHALARIPPGPPLPCIPRRVFRTSWNLK